VHILGDQYDGPAPAQPLQHAKDMLKQGAIWFRQVTLPVA
jgi:hypothetical protein